MRNFAIVISVASVAVAGCSNFYEPKPHEVHLTRESTVSGTASLAHTFVIDKDTAFVTCSQPPPDAAFSQGSSEAFALSILNFGSGREKQGAAERSQEVELTGRTPAVLMARELFFRMCEFARNHELNKAEAQRLYLKTLDIVKQVWAVEAGNTTVTIGETDTKNVGQTVSGTAPSESAVTESSSSTTTSDESSSSESTDGESESQSESDGDSDSG